MPKGGVDPSQKVAFHYLIYGNSVKNQNFGFCKGDFVRLDENQAHAAGVRNSRKRILEGRLARRIEELLRECADVNRWKIEELNIQKDHVHMVLQFRPDVALSKMVQLFKGKSSKIIRQEFSELKEVYWGNSFWADGFFAETVGKVDLEVIKAYVRNQ